jgi:hypothetical protein
MSENDTGWMENYPLHLVKKIAKGGKDIDPVGRRVAQAELQRRESLRGSVNST